MCLLRTLIEKWWDAFFIFLITWKTNHLPPSLCLSDQIAQNRKTIVCPMIDVIDHDNFGYDTQAGDAMRGAFDWEMYYKRIPIPPELLSDDPSEPFEWVTNIPHGNKKLNLHFVRLIDTFRTAFFYQCQITILKASHKLKDERLLVIIGAFLFWVKADDSCQSPVNDGIFFLIFLQQALI